MAQMTDLAPWPRERDIPEQQRELDKELEKIAKENQKAEKKAEKARRKAQKKAERAKKKAEKQSQQSATDLSATSVGTVETVPYSADTASAASCALVPSEVVLLVCAALLVCVGSAWFFRYKQPRPVAS